MTMTLERPIKQTSQKQHILAHLHSIDPSTGQTRGLSPFEAIGLYRIFRLAARIEELRDDGYDINTVIKHDTTGKVYARYFLNGV